MLCVPECWWYWAVDDLMFVFLFSLFAHLLCRIFVEFFFFFRVFFFFGCYILWSQEVVWVCICLRPPKNIPNKFNSITSSISQTNINCHCAFVGGGVNGEKRAEPRNIQFENGLWSALQISEIYTNMRIIKVCQCMMRKESTEINWKSLHRNMFELMAMASNRRHGHEVLSDYRPAKSVFESIWYSQFQLRALDAQACI